MNLIDPDVVGPADVYDQVAGQAEIARTELVGLVPRSVLDRIDPGRWSDLDLAPARTIESRLAEWSRRPNTRSEPEAPRT
jgi:hypothetical protein